MKSRHVKSVVHVCIFITKAGIYTSNWITTIAFYYFYRSFLATSLSVFMACIKRFILTPALFILLIPVHFVFQIVITALKCIQELIHLSAKRKHMYIIFDFLFSYDSFLTRAISGSEDDSWGIGSKSMTNNTEAQPFLERCSICFDSKLDFCLEKCRDQFCLDCFRKYVNEVVKSSWGLSVTVIKCPVCRATIPPGEWKKYLSESTIEIYNRFNRPFRSFSKHCPSCEMEVIPCNSSSTDKKRVYVKGLSKLIAKNIIKFYEKYPSEERQGHNQFVQIFNNLEFRNSTLFEIHHQLLKSLLDLCRNNKESERSVKDISLQILQLEMQPETWRRLQFDHISFFPNIECLNCQTEFCLQCGDKAHGNLSCEEYMEELLRLKGKDSTYLDNDDVKTIEWKLKYSRRCPSCSMMINRDEGCNKIDCTFCGFSFCWQCRSLWSKDCGYFLCASEKKHNTTTTSAERIASLKAADNTVTELGLPNLDLIYAKLNAGKED